MILLAQKIFTFALNGHIYPKPCFSHKVFAKTSKLLKKYRNPQNKFICVLASATKFATELL